MNEVEKKPIAPVLNRMKIGDVEQWSIDRYDNVRITVSRFNIKYRAEPRKYRCRANGLNVEVVRMQ